MLATYLQSVLFKQMPDLVIEEILCLEDSFGQQWK